jgi:hypothetical protein
VPDGIYHLLAAALPRLADTLGYLLPDSGNLSVGAWNGPVIVQHGRAANGPFNITLRPMALTDPPLLISLPFLLAEPQLATSRVWPPVPVRLVKEFLVLRAWPVVVAVTYWGVLLFQKPQRGLLPAFYATSTTRPSPQ